MPLDTGAVTHSLLMSAGVDMADHGEHTDTALEGALSVGAALRATRLRLGRSLQDVADATRIKRAYLEALEEMRIEELPSRPFTIGYVRAYARTLGLDAEAAVTRFKQDAPGDVEPLRAPVGVRKHSDARISLLAGGGAVIVSAVLLWNLAQHAMTEEAPPPPIVVESSGPAVQPSSAPPAPVTLTAAQPAPQESTLPTPYQTPGMDAASATPGSADAAGKPAVAVVSAAAADPAAPQTFTPHGAIYGAAAAASSVTLQAKKSVSLVIRGADGTVYFAQQLKAGEAYRAPAAKNLMVDVSDPAALGVYVNGALHGALPAPVTPLSQLNASTQVAAAG